VPRNELPDYEHLVVHDGSTEFTDRLKLRFPWLRILQGPGRGQFGASVLALKEARGDFIIPLNSDDLFVPGALAQFVQASEARPEVDVWTGGTRLFEQTADGGQTTLRIVDDPAATALTVENILLDLPLMTARFVHRRVYERLGLYDEDYAVCWDREFALRMALAGVTEASLGVRLSELRIHDEAMTHRRKGGFIPTYLPAHAALARQELRRGDLPRDTRRILRDWHAQEISRLVYYQLLGRRPFAAAKTFGAGFLEDRAWVVHALSNIRAMRMRRRRV
jgi:GT2 family glycosyltransferase